MNLAGRHAVVTGGGSGIGAATARALDRAGACVTVMGRRLEPLQAVAASLRDGSAIACDVTDEASVIEAFEAAHERAPIAILVNNAGAAETAPFAKTDIDLFDRMTAVNLTGPFLCAREALRRMHPQAYGRVITVASTAGLKGYAYCAAYCAAKHGAIGLMRALAAERAAGGITFNAVCPGFTDTDLVADALDAVTAMTGRDRDAALEEFTRHNPQGRLIAPEEVADTVLWLCGDQARGVTGQAIAVAGGEVT